MPVMKDLIDLHTHTTASDGSVPPAQLVAQAKALGLEALAVTDHDTTAGLDEALAAGRDSGLEVIAGVEISVAGPNGGSLHMVGLFVDHRAPALAEGLARLQQARAQRNPKIVANFRELGIDLTLEEVRGFAGGGQVGRPHFAQALAARGVVSHPDEAFRRYLAPGRPAYAPKFRFEPAEAMAMLKAAAGVPILAHPGVLKLRWAELERLIAQLRGQGLEGVEAYHSDHSAADQGRLLGLARRLGLVVSGGSDFHGAPKPKVRLGVGKGKLRVPAGLLPHLRERARRIRLR